MSRELRIMIIGRPGSGKSTFSFDLHQCLNIPLYHLDKIFFESSWKERKYKEFLDMQQQWVKSSSWIIDGNSTKSYELRYQRATHCLYFNFPRYLCYWRVFKRLWHKNPSIDDRAESCNEVVRWPLLKYMWDFDRRVKPKLEHLKNQYPQVTFIEVCKDEQLRALEVS